MAVLQSYAPQTVFTFSIHNLIIDVPWEILSPDHVSLLILNNGEFEPVNEAFYDVRGNKIHMHHDMLPDGTQFYVRRKVDLTQPYSSEGVNHVRPRDLERALDRVIMAAQELQSRELFTHIMEDFQSLGYIENQQGWRLGADGAADISGHFNGEVTITGGTIAREVEIVGSTSHRQSIEGFADVFVGAVDVPSVSELIVDGTGRYIAVFVQITRFFPGTRSIHLQISKDNLTWFSLPENPDVDVPGSWMGTAGAHTNVEDTSLFIGPLPMETEIIEGEEEPVPTTYYVRARGVRSNGDATDWTPGEAGIIRPVEGAEIVAGAITANKIAAGAITAEKIAAGVIDAIEINVDELFSQNIFMTGSITSVSPGQAAPIRIGRLGETDVGISVGTYFTFSEIEDEEGNIVIDENGNVLLAIEVTDGPGFYYSYEGNELLIRGKLAVGSVDIDSFDETIIEGGKIKASVIDVDDIFSQNITATGMITGAQLRGGDINIDDVFIVDSSGAITYESNNVTLGLGANGFAESVTIGVGAESSGSNSVAVGDNAQADGSYLIAIGHLAKATSFRPVVISSQEFGEEVENDYGRGSIISFNFLAFEHTIQLVYNQLYEYVWDVTGATKGCIGTVNRTDGFSLFFNNVRWKNNNELELRQNGTVVVTIDKNAFVMDTVYDLFNGGERLFSISLMFSV